MSSALQTQPNEVPEESGWILEDAKYQIKWFEGEVTLTLLDVVDAGYGGSVYGSLYFISNFTQLGFL